MIMIGLGFFTCLSIICLPMVFFKSDTIREGLKNNDELLIRYIENLKFLNKHKFGRRY